MRTINRTQHEPDEKVTTRPRSCNCFMIVSETFFADLVIGRTCRGSDTTRTQVKRSGSHPCRDRWGVLPQARRTGASPDPQTRLDLPLSVVTVQSPRIAHPERTSMAKYRKKATRKVQKVMHEWKRGTLRSGGSGQRVTSRAQAIAIGLSEARRDGAKVLPRTRRKRPAPRVVRAPGERQPGPTGPTGCRSSLTEPRALRLWCSAASCP